MVPLIAIGAVGALVWTGYRAYRKETEKLKREEALNRVDPTSPVLTPDPKTGRYTLPKERRDVS